MAAPKIVVATKITWGEKKHPDYREAAIRIGVEGRPEVDARLVMLAHISREPRKYDFTLLLGSACALRLDVNPGSTHFDPVTLTSVAGTHWQPWPCLSAELDEREFNHLGWFNEFLKKAAITCGSIGYEPPPFEAGEQGEFEL